MLDLLITNASLPDGRTGMSVAVQGGKIIEIKEGLTATAHETLDVGGMLLAPPFVDAHFHMDATLKQEYEGQVFQQEYEGQVFQYRILIYKTGRSPTTPGVSS